ncbi:hypothetical protein BLNAU_7906 [Blattamonas nauphoetae]|uniref:Uncharacterized protein n=1 Tax=Blattamonas nauphoetae TaxID=2049346 RepID=A0ABQ9Y019_9EUKA|nr:hypothetical protein BLNAU_7906 [Blattamonas nauphoetae]
MINTFYDFLADLLDSDSEKPRNEVKPTILTLQTNNTLIASTLRRQNRGDQFLKVVIPAILPILSLPQTVPPRLSTNHTPAAPPKILPDPTSHRPLKPLSGPASSSTTPPSPPQLPLFLPPLPTEGPLLFEANTPSSMMVSLPPSLPSSIPPPLRSSSSSFPPPLPPFTGNVDEDQSFGLPYNNNRNMGISGSDAAMIGLIDELTRKNTYINIARTHTNPYAVSPSFIPPEVQKAHPAPFVPPTIHIASSRSPNPTSSLSRQHLKKRYTIREKPNVVIRHYLPENNKNPSQLRSSRLISAAVDGIQQDLSNQSSRHSPSPPAYPTIPYALPPSIAVPKHLPHGPIMAGENLPPFQRIMAVYVNSNLGAWYVGGRKPPSSPTEYLGGSVGSDADKHSLPTVSFYSPSVSGRPYASDAEWPSIARGSDIVETIIPSTLSTTSQPALPPPPQPIRLNPTPPSTNPTTPHYSPTPLPQTLPPPIPHSNTFQQSTHTPTTFTQTQFTPPQFKSPTQYTQTQFPQNQFTSTHLPSHPPPHQFASQSAPRPFTPNTPVPTQFTPGHFAIAADSPPLTPFVTPRYLPSAIPQNHEPFNRPPIERLPKPPMPHTSVNSQIPIPPPHRQHLPPPRTDSDPWTNTPTPEYGNRTNPAVPLNPQQSLDFWNGRQGFERQPSRDAFPPQISRDFRDQVDSPSNRNVQDQRTSRDRRHSRDRRDSHNRYDSPARSRRGDRRRRSYNRYSSSPSPPPTTSSGWDCVKADTAISITEDDLVDPNTYYLDSNGNRIPIRQQAQPKKAQQQGWGTSGLPPDDTSRTDAGHIHALPPDLLRLRTLILLALVTGAKLITILLEGGHTHSSQRRAVTFMGRRQTSFSPGFFTCWV